MAIFPFKESKICFAEKKDGSAIYATYLADEDEKELPRYIQIDAFTSTDETRIPLLGSEEEIEWTPNGKGIHITLPRNVIEHPPGKNAWVLKMESVMSASR